MIIETQWRRYVDWEAIGSVFIKEIVDGWLVIARVGKGYITLGQYFCEERAKEVYAELAAAYRRKDEIYRIPEA